eukprot:TRINITY_DN1505_c0_g1_i4.p1 TRINITY_DN1505_c0_g1~~TRINITY_DN1505_c0_g1_i4.p1  ORF type:complete len:366 (-),score=91.07 TRINITY_DN1505_c0_g1_i4:376-1473(-)
MKSILLLMILKLIFAGTAIASDNAYSQAVQKMTSDLYLEIAKTSNKENIVISPLSIHTAMSMLHYGADGNSLKQLKNGLGLENLPKDVHLSEIRKLMDEYEELDNENLTLNMANALYGAKDLDVNVNFVNLVENQFDAKYEKIDFSNKKNAVKVINTWASNKTNNLINELVSEEGLDSDVRMVIMNAVYFKAKWMKPFNKRGTMLKSFNVPGKGEIQTDFMYLSDSIESASIAELNATLVALPYIDDDYKMLIFHPDESSNIEELEESLFSSKATIEDYTRQLENKESRLHFPKFETGSDLSLVTPFQGLNVTDIFGDSANFSRMSKERDIKVGDIIHKPKSRYLRREVKLPLLPELFLIQEVDL